MFLYFLLAATVFNANANPVYESSLVPKIRVKRIIGGSKSKIEDHPYQVAIERDEEEYGAYKCSGAILSRNYILTAAHCINNTAVGIRIRSGSSLREEGGTVHIVVERFIHESYYLNEYKNSNFDIAVARVEPSFDYGPNCQPISLNEGEVVSNDFTMNEKLMISGWGVEDHNYNLPDELQTLQVPWISKNSCNELYRPFGGIYEGQICTGYIGVRDKDVCGGDSGAPLVFNDRVIGVAAYTEGQCGLKDYPTVYSEVAYFIDWINQHVKFDESYMVNRV